MSHGLLQQQAANTHLAGYVRIALWCWGNANPHGHARAYTSQLRTELGFSSAREVSRALRHARNRGLIDRCSNASCVVVPGCGLGPCEANHR